jgi:hypothetical protein
VPGVDPDLLRRVEDFVESDETLTFVEGGSARTIALVSATE